MGSYIALGSYTLWLLSFPMNGFLSHSSLVFFLLPHSITFILIGMFHKIRLPTNFFNASVVLTAILTFIYPYMNAYMQTVNVVVLGIFATFVLLKVSITLKSSERILLNVAIGLSIGNTLLFLILHIPFSPMIKMDIISMFILLTLFPLKNFYSPINEYHLKRFVPYVLSIFLFYLLSGWLYEVENPLYSHVSFFKGIELIFYIGAVFIGYFILNKKNSSLPLAIAVILSAIALLSFAKDRVIFSNLSMFLLQIAFGLVDYFFLIVLLKYENIFKSIGLGMGIMGIAITISDIILQNFKLPFIAVKLGEVVLVSEFFIIYLFFGVDIDKEKDGNEYMIERYRDLLSEREFEVLKLLIINKKSLKEIAETIKISPSTVKTYTSRIYKKLEVTNKRELIHKLKSTFKK